MDKHEYDMDGHLGIGTEEEIRETYDDYIQSLEKRDEIRNLSRNDVAKILVERIVEEESYISVLYKVMKLLSDKENDDLGIENADFTAFLRDIGIKSLESAWSALIGLGVASIVGVIASIRIKRLKRGKKIKLDDNDRILLTLDEIEVLMDFFAKRENMADFQRQIVQTDETIHRKYKKRFVNRMLEIKLECLEKQKELVSAGTISNFSEKALKNITNDLTKKIKM